MSTKFSFSIADSSQDDDLRSIIRRTPMPGSISLAWCREPSFFFAQNVGCIQSETIICKRNDTGKIIGFGGRSLWNVYQNGKEKTIWYLHSLRLLAEERDGTALLRGYRYFSSLLNNSDVPYFFTTILDDNEYAKRLLEKRRPGMPRYSRIGTMITHLIPLRVKRGMKKRNDAITKCSPEFFSSACTCMNEWNRQYDFAPVYTIDDMQGRGRLFPQFSFENLYISLSGAEVNGTLGLWNQQPFKQLIVDSYSKSYEIMRYVNNIWSFFKDLPYLPSVGKEVKILHASFLSIKDDSPLIFEQLIDRGIKDHSGSAYDWLAIGICADHPLEKVLSKKSKRQLASGVYIVSWEEDIILFPKKQIHLEIALL